MTVSRITASTVYVAPISNGLGDLICSLPVVQTLIKCGIKTYLILRSSAQNGLESRIEGLTGTVSEDDCVLLKLAKEPDVQVLNLRDHPLQTAHIWGSDEFLKAFPDTCIDDIISKIANDFGLDGDFDVLKPLATKDDARAKDKILLIPGSRGSQKCWPVTKWLELTRKLQDDGIKCAILGRPQFDPSVSALIDQGLEWLETKELTDAVDVISSARAVVGVDTGLMHLAVHQHIPTVALFRHNAVFARKKRHVRSLLAPRCPASCIAAEFNSDCHKQLTFKNTDEGASTFYWSSWQCQEPAEAHCMASIKSEEVYEALFDLTGVRH